jgi:glutamate synthase domain-containing protein 3
VQQEHGLEEALDNKLIELCRKSIEDKAQVRFHSIINNTNRTVGTMLSSEIAKRYGMAGLRSDTIQVDFTGTAGQSFGAFLSHGITFRLEGDANDYVGKGLSGGKIIIMPPADSPFAPEENVIAGNVVLYGAIKGEMYLRGIAGERFAVRNSGAKAVVEGVGDHGCEYMTGGRVVVLGDVGRNFAAGMSGGIAFVWDRNRMLEKLYNPGMVELFPVEQDEDIAELRQLIERHFRYTSSYLARHIMRDWNYCLTQFVKVYPTEYRRVQEAVQKETVTV